jgi:hypothetical protein
MKQLAWASMNWGPLQVIWSLSKSMFRWREKIDPLTMLYWSLPRWNTRVAKEVKAGLTPVQILVCGLAMLHDSMPSLIKSLEPSRKKRCAAVAD